MAISTVDKPLAIALMGPTAAGKTDLSLALAEYLGTDIISVDSALVYRGMDIGTAKPTAQEQARIKHHLIDIRDPAEAYSAADFARDAASLMSNLSQRGKTPVLVGGTMLYFKALLDGLSPIPPSDPKIRADIEARAEREGWPALHRLLSSVDPETASALHPNHSQRIGRALEVFYGTNKPLSAYKQLKGQGELQRYRWIQCAIAPIERSVLHQKIAKRFDLMLQCGFIDEVRSLYERGDLSLNMPSMRSVGYRQAWLYLDGALSYNEMRDAGVAATRQLAKRQFTWLKSWHDLSWLKSDKPTGEVLKTEEILHNLLNIIGNTGAERRQ